MAKISVELMSIAELDEAVAAARLLKAKGILVRGAGTWIEVAPSGKLGDLCFRVPRVLRALRGNKRVRAIVDGVEVTIEPYRSDSEPRGAILILDADF